LELASVTELLFTGPKKSHLTVILTHGAGAPMDTPFMDFFAEGIAAAKMRVARFEFPYMAERRKDGRKRPPDREPILLATWREAIAEVGGSVVIGGKSMGGRMASLIAAASDCPAEVQGLLCLGYPFYGAGRKDKPRTAHLAALKVPTLICQGTRDPMGDKESVTVLKLSRGIKVHWAEDGNHDLAPRKASGLTTEGTWQGALDAAMAFLARLAP
jgi:predicted alpha/beta-hydrolase family hydrolase